MGIINVCSQLTAELCGVNQMTLFGMIFHDLEKFVKRSAEHHYFELLQ